MNTASLHLVHSARVTAPRPLNQYDRASIAHRCLIFGKSRWTVAREYGVPIQEINDICDAAMFERGRIVGRNETRFLAPLKCAA